MKQWVLICAIIMAVSGCARDIESDVYSNENVEHSSSVYEGVVVRYRKVTVNSQENVLGALAGGVVGGVAGNAIGGGRGRTLMTALGAVGGAAAGSATQKALSKQTAIEYVVKINGEMKRIIQGPKVIYTPGQKVLVSIGTDRPRILSAI